MNPEMINILPTTPTHTTPIHNREASSPQIITSKNPPPCGCPNRKIEYQNLKGKCQHQVPSKHYRKSEYQNLHPFSTSTSLDPHPHYKDYDTPVNEENPPPTPPPNH